MIIGGVNLEVTPNMVGVEYGGQLTPISALSEPGPRWINEGRDQTFINISKPFKRQEAETLARLIGQFHVMPFLPLKDPFVRRKILNKYLLPSLDFHRSQDQLTEEELLDAFGVFDLIVALKSYSLSMNYGRPDTIEFSASFMPVNYFPLHGSYIYLNSAGLEVPTIESSDVYRDCMDWAVGPYVKTKKSVKEFYSYADHYQVPDPIENSSDVWNDMRVGLQMFKPDFGKTMHERIFQGKVLDANIMFEEMDLSHMVNSISITYDNNFRTLPIEGMTTGLVQYLGQGSHSIQIEMLTKAQQQEVVDRLRSMTITLQRWAKDRIMSVSSSCFWVKNPLLNMLGVYNILADNILQVRSNEMPDSETARIHFISTPPALPEDLRAAERINDENILVILRVMLDMSPDDFRIMIDLSKSRGNVFSKVFGGLWTLVLRELKSFTDHLHPDGYADYILDTSILENMASNLPSNARVEQLVEILGSLKDEEILSENQFGIHVEGFLPFIPKTVLGGAVPAAVGFIDHGVMGDISKSPIHLRRTDQPILLYFGLMSGDWVRELFWLKAAGCLDTPEAKDLAIEKIKIALGREKLAFNETQIPSHQLIKYMAEYHLLPSSAIEAMELSYTSILTGEPMAPTFYPDLTVPRVSDLYPDGQLAERPDRPKPLPFRRILPSDICDILSVELSSLQAAINDNARETRMQALEFTNDVGEPVRVTNKPEDTEHAIVGSPGLEKFGATAERAYKEHVEGKGRSYSNEEGTFEVIGTESLRRMYDMYMRGDDNNYLTQFGVLALFPAVQLLFLELDDLRKNNWHDMYQKSGIIDISVHGSKGSPAQHAIINVDNHMMTLPMAATNVPVPDEDEESETAIQEGIAAHFPIQPGARVVLRGGYLGADHKLPTMFTGVVRDFGLGSIVSLQCDGLGYTLLTPVDRGEAKEEYVGRTRSARKVAERLVNDPIHGDHFGKWESDTTSNRRNRKGWWPGIWSQNQQDDNLFYPERYGHGKISRFYMTGNTMWESLQDLCLFYPGWICQVRPYDERATVYFGPPSGTYFWTANKTFEEEKVRRWLQKQDDYIDEIIDLRMKPTQDTGMYNLIIRELMNVVPHIKVEFPDDLIRLNMHAERHGLRLTERKNAFIDEYVAETGGKVPAVYSEPFGGRFELDLTVGDMDENWDRFYYLEETDNKPYTQVIFTPWSTLGEISGLRTENKWGVEAPGPEPPPPLSPYGETLNKSFRETLTLRARGMIPKERREGLPWTITGNKEQGWIAIEYADGTWKYIHDLDEAGWEQTMAEQETQRNEQLSTLHSDFDDPVLFEIFQRLVNELRDDKTYAREKFPPGTLAGKYPVGEIHSAIVARDYDPETGRHFVVYTNGDTANLTLPEEDYKAEVERRNRVYQQALNDWNIEKRVYDNWLRDSRLQVEKDGDAVYYAKQVRGWMNRWMPKVDKQGNVSQHVSVDKVLEEISSRRRNRNNKWDGHKGIWGLVSDWIKEMQKHYEGLGVASWISELNPRLRPFRRVWSVSSNNNLIRNEIVASENFYNSVNVQGPTSSPTVVKWMTNKIGNSKPVHSVDIESLANGYSMASSDGAKTYKDLTYKPTFKNKLHPGLDDKKVRTKFVQKRNAVYEEQLKSVAWTLLMRQANRMYRGTLHIVGNPEIFDHHLVYINDYNNDMYGFVEVDEYIHTFSRDTGFVTSITPHLHVTFGEGTPSSTGLITSAKRVGDWVGGLWGIGHAYRAAYFLNSATPLNMLGEGAVRGTAGAGQYLWSMITSERKDHPLTLAPLMYREKAFVAGIDGYDINDFTVPMWRKIRRIDEWRQKQVDEFADVVDAVFLRDQRLKRWYGTVGVMNF